MNAGDLLQDGYKKFEDSFAPDYCKPQYAYQRKIYRDEKLIYFINVYEYDWSKFNLRDNMDRFTYECKIHLYKPGDDMDCLRIQFDCTKSTVSMLEDFVYNIYTKLECVPDKHND